MNNSNSDNMISTRAFRTATTAAVPYGPRLLGFNGAVASHHHQSALAAYQILNAGGNAVDAGVAAVLVEGVVNPHMHGPAGECPIIVAGPDLLPTAINGNTMAPARATAETYLDRGFTEVPPEGVLAAGVPASLAALLTALERFGTLPFHTLVEPAATLARAGFAMHSGLRNQEKVGVAAQAGIFSEQRSSSAEIYLDQGIALALGARVCNPRLADVYETLAARSRAQSTRQQGYDAVRNEFYRGSVAAAIERYVREHDGLLEANDLATFETPVEQPLAISFADTTIYKGSTWCQGPALLQTLLILKQFDLAALTHNSADYCHLLVEATKLAYADREQYYADPMLVDVPITELLSTDYAAQRAALIDLQQANAELRPGDPANNHALLAVDQRLGGSSWGPGTVHVDVGDSRGMLASFTPSGGWLASNEVIPELGFPLGNRLMTFYLTPAHHPNRIAPHKRPRTTISPSLVTRADKPWLAFGSMGGDQQDQWMLQLYLNMALFDMPVQQAIEAPKLSSEHFNGFFAPHDRFPQRLRLEDQIDSAVIDGLRRRGHEIDLAPMWTEGYLNAVLWDARTGCLEAAVDPRGAKGEVFPATALAW